MYTLALWPNSLTEAVLVRGTWMEEVGRIWDGNTNRTFGLSDNWLLRLRKQLNSQ